ncbi:MAG: response regulator [Chloroflexi bacterium]|nr:response regulator [Chloroflexota bacterium]
MAIIVVADDEPGIRDLLAYSLRRRGHTVVTAADGDAAWQAIIETHPALIVLDVMMPGVSGLDLAKRVGADPSVAQTPIIVTSGGVWDDEIGAGLTSVNIRFVAKPFSPRDLVSQIDSILSGQPSDL